MTWTIARGLQAEAENLKFEDNVDRFRHVVIGMQKAQGIGKLNPKPVSLEAFIKSVNYLLE
jgi:hypothetical protein